MKYKTFVSMIRESNNILETQINPGKSSREEKKIVNVIEIMELEINTFNLFFFLI